MCAGGSFAIGGVVVVFRGGGIFVFLTSDHWLHFENLVTLVYR